ncbi:hypothetical protein Tco_1133336 [Tanacetum coccineum]
MHTSREDYLINTLRFVIAKEETQIYGAILPDSLTSPEMKETKVYKTYLVSTKEPTGKSKRVKRPAKKSTKAPSRGVVIRETPKIPLSKKKEMVDVTREVRRKSMRDFHKTHPSGSGAVKIIPLVTSEETGVKPGVPDVTEEESSELNASDDDKTQSDDENESNSEHETDENESDETKITDKAEGDEDEEIDYTTSQLYDDVDIRLNEPIDTDKGFKTKVPVTSSSHSSDLAAKFLNFSDIPHIDAEIVSPMDVHVHHEVPSQQTPTLLTVPVLVISDSSPVFSTVIPQSFPSFTPPPQQSTFTPPPTTKAINPPSTLPNFTSDPLHTQVTALVDDHLDARLGATIDEFMNFLSASLTTRITEQSLEDDVLAKESSQPQSSYEAAATLTKFELKKILIDKIDKMYSLKRIRKDKDEDPSIGSDRGLKKRNTSKDAAPAIGPKAKESQSGSYKGDKSQSKFSRMSIQSEELEFEVADSNMPQDQEENLGKDDEEPKEKVASKRNWFTKPTQPQEPTDPDWNVDKTLQ